MSLFDLINLPMPGPYAKLRTTIKAALGPSLASPELACHVGVKASIDPETRWLLAGLRIWHEILRIGEHLQHLDHVLAGKTRLATLARFVSDRYLLYRKKLRSAPSAFSVAHLLPKFAEAGEISHWKQSCRWAISVLHSKRDLVITTSASHVTEKPIALSLFLKKILHLLHEMLYHKP